MFLAAMAFVAAALVQLEIDVSALTLSMPNIFPNHCPLSALILDLKTSMCFISTEISAYPPLKLSDPSESTKRGKQWCDGNYPT